MRSRIVNFEAVQWFRRKERLARTEHNWYWLRKLVRSSAVISKERWVSQNLVLSIVTSNSQICRQVQCFRRSLSRICRQAHCFRRSFSRIYRQVQCFRGSLCRICRQVQCFRRFSRPSAANGDSEGPAAVISSGFVDRCSVFEGSAEGVYPSPVQSPSENLLIDMCGYIIC